MKDGDAGTRTSDFPYIWDGGTGSGEYPYLRRRKGQRCRVLWRSSRMNMVRVEFEDGHRLFTSSNGLRRIE